MGYLNRWKLVKAMIPTNLNLKLDEEAIKKFIQETLTEKVEQEILLVDVKKISELLSMSPRFIEDVFLQDPRIKQFEVRRNKKRWYWYRQTIETIKQIIKEDW